MYELRPPIGQAVCSAAKILFYTCQKIVPICRSRIDVHHTDFIEAFRQITGDIGAYSSLQFYCSYEIDMFPEFLDMHPLKLLQFCEKYRYHAFDIWQKNLQILQLPAGPVLFNSRNVRVAWNNHYKEKPDFEFYWQE